jgi:plasmid stabilization system protein ParE
MKKKLKLEWSPLAKEDLRRLRRWIIAAGAPKTAKSFLSRVRKYVARLRDFPEFGSVIENYNDPLFREVVFQDQRIVYRFDGVTVLIPTVFHGSHTPNLSHWLGD